ncbi:Izumo Sperm-Egg Fusion Protein 3 [Manis pentadactyla]|nr:Izumo Sperm-Egg Fusion Protein 3 [Manis pentadactyla]
MLLGQGVPKCTLQVHLACFLNYREVTCFGDCVQVQPQVEYSTPRADCVAPGSPELVPAETPGRSQLHEQQQWF